ncbi:hypothetical protein FACS1894191_2430 [Clostridia bacterium]|nr:hypothetical protein FACS1894191_2430 [Clostridia bacterium]
MPFIESKPLVDLVADVIKDYGLRLLPDSASHWCDIVGYYYCVDLLALYVFKQKEDFEGILSILGNEVEKEIACRKLKIERGGKDNGVMLRIFRFYEKDMSAFAGLIVKLNSP